MIVDSHHHLWNLSAVDYPWLNARGVRRFFGDPTPIQRDYLPADFRADHGGKVAASVHIQVGAADPFAETCWLSALPDGPAAIVAAADLTAPDLDAQLDRHLSYGPRLRGVRQIVSRHPSEDAATGSAALLADPRFEAGLRRLGLRALSFDLQLSPPLLPAAAKLFARVPDVPVALCHCGSPWDQSAEGLARWRADLGAFAAAAPLSTCKLSGFGMFDARWTRATLAPLVDGVLAAFGPERTMWGSNFPVDRLARGYAELFETVRACVPAAMHAPVFGTTAARFYGLVLPRVAS